jgi:pimeloyl-ACP methyl ester carboxylesterase
MQQGAASVDATAQASVQGETPMVLESRKLDVDGVSTELMEAGSGQPLLFLHSGEGPTTISEAYIKELARDFHVFAPWHPGFGPSPRPKHFRGIHDLAYFYLDLADALGLKDAVLVGASFGGWIAAEVSVRSMQSFSHLVLCGPLGIKAGTRETRSIVDFSAMSPQDWYAAAFANQDHAKRDYQSMKDEQLVGLLRSRESLLYYGWEPFMHNPQLPHWLHRIKRPALVLRGACDRVVTAECHQTYADGIPGAKLTTVADAGHYPHIEQPHMVSRAIREFVRTPAMAAA